MKNRILAFAMLFVAPLPAHAQDLTSQIIVEKAVLVDNGLSVRLSGYYRCEGAIMFVMTNLVQITGKHRAYNVEVDDDVRFCQEGGFQDWSYTTWALGSYRYTTGKAQLDISASVCNETESECRVTRTSTQIRIEKR